MAFAAKQFGLPVPRRMKFSALKGGFVLRQLIANQEREAFFGGRIAAQVYIIIRNCTVKYSIKWCYKP
jgi:hypothetical protein